jgi:transposase InsO family protein
VSADSTQTLDDHGVLASVGSVGDAYDNALAEWFVDSFKIELIADRVHETQLKRSPSNPVRLNRTNRIA